MRNHRAAFFSLVLCGALGASLLHAQEPDRGRLPDGRAYRTDSDGNQLVDYIAELEVDLETKERQIRGLQAELDERNAMLARVERGAPATAAISERSLVGAAKPPPAEVKPQFVGCEAEQAALRRAEGELQQIKSSLEAERRQHHAALAEYRQALQGVQGDAASRQESIANCRAKLEQITTSSLATARELEDTRRRLVDERASWEAQRSALTIRVTKLEAQLAEAVKTPAFTATRQESVQPAQEARVVPSRSPAQQRAVESLRGNLRSEIQRIRGQIQRRDSLFAEYARSAQAVQLRPSPARSRRNRTLDDIARDLDQAATVYQITSLRSELHEIAGRVQEDVALATRMLRNRR